MNDFELNIMYVKELDYFLKCVKNKNQTFNDINDGIKTLQVVLNAKKSTQSRKMINLKQNIKKFVINHINRLYF